MTFKVSRITQLIVVLIRALTPIRRSAYISHNTNWLGAILALLVIHDILADRILFGGSFEILPYHPFDCRVVAYSGFDGYGGLGFNSGEKA